MPTSKNVDRIIKDFSDGRQQYLGAHLFFVDGTLSRVTSAAARVENRCGLGLSETLFERLTTSPAEPHLKGLQDLYVNFWGKFLV